MADYTYRNSSNDTVISGREYASNNIYNMGNNVTLTGGRYADYFENSGSNVLIYAYAGADEVVNSGDSTYINTGDGNDVVSNRGKNVTIYGGAGKDTITTYGDSSLVSLGADSNSVNAYANNVTIKASHGHQTVQSKPGSGTYIEGSDSDEIITIQRNGSGSGVVATVKGGGGNDTINGSAGADVFVYTGTDGNDVIYNWDSNDQILLTSGSVDDSMTNDTGDVVLNIGYSSITIKDATDKTINISNGSITPTPSTSTTLTIDDSTSSPVTAPANIITIDASSRTSAVRITGNSKANSIISGQGNDTLTGGGGNDVFIYSSGSGNDVITDYTSGQDKIKIIGAKISKTSVSGNDVILSVSSGSIRVKNGKGKSLSLYNNANSITTTVIGGPAPTLPSGLTYTNNRKTITAKSPFTGKIDLSKYASTVTTVDATTDTKFVNIKGTSRNEVLRAGKGGSSLAGGKGNDTLYGGIGADIFVYASGDGKDVIQNYSAAQDRIKITSGTISRVSVSGSNVVLTIGSGSLTINNAKGKDINITDKSGDTETYNFTGTVTNPTANFEERWFLDNSELGIRNSELSSILEDKADIAVDYKFDDSNFKKNTDIIPLSINHQKK